MYVCVCVSVHICVYLSCVACPSPHTHGIYTCMYASQAVADEDCIYALPAVAGGGFDLLQDLLHGAQASSSSSNGIVADCNGPLDEHALSMSAAAPSTCAHVFRVLHFAPKSQKTMKSAANKLGSDQIAVASFDVESLDWESRTGTISSALRRGNSAVGIRTVGLKQFYNLGPHRLRTGLVSCTLSPSMVYTFQGPLVSKYVNK